MDQDRQSIIDTEKFSKVFGSIEKQMLMQSSFLESIYNINTQQLDMERDRAKKEAARLAALSAQGAEETIGGTTTTGAGNVDLGAASDKQKESILSSIIPGIGNFIGSLFGTIGGMGLAGLGSKVIGAGALAILAPAVGNFIAEFSKSALEDWNPGGGEFNTGVSAALGAAGTWGMIGRIFGARIATIFALGGGGVSLGGSIFDSLDANEDGVIEAFGMSFSDTEFKTLGGAVGGALGLFLPGMISSALGPVFAAMTLPGAGLVALSAVALLGSVALIDRYMDGQRNELIDNINNEIKLGLDKFKAEKDRGFLDKLWTGFVGADANDPLGAQLQDLESILQSEQIKQSGSSMEFGEISDLDISAIEDPEVMNRIEDFKKILRDSVNNTTTLEGFSENKLQQIARLTDQLGLVQENKKVTDQLAKLNAAAAEVRNQSAADLQATAEAMSSSLYTDTPITTESVIDQNPVGNQARLNRESEYGIDRDRQREIRYDRSMAALSKIESASSSTPIIVPVPMVTPAQNASAAPSQIDQSTTSNSTTIYSGRSKFDELDTFVIGAR
jgi:hypothetical protein